MPQPNTDFDPNSCADRPLPIAGGEAELCVSLCERMLALRLEPNDHCLNELKEIAALKGTQANARGSVSPDLTAWLRAVGEPDHLNADDARS